MHFLVSAFSPFFPEKPTLKKFLILSQKGFPNFQETEPSYILGKVYSEPAGYSEHCQTSTIEHFAKIST